MKIKKQAIRLCVNSILLFIALFLSSTYSLKAATPRIDSSFYPIISDGGGIIKSIAIQPDGKTLIGGLFPQANGEEQVSIARLHPNGSVDTTFSPVRVLSSNLPGTVYDIKLQNDNKILIAGDFRSVSGIDRNGLARLNSDGTLDTAFQNGMSGGNNPFIYSMAIQSDGKIIIGGQFSTFNDVISNGLARLNPDGSIDSTFQNPKPSGVNSVAIQPDGKILIGGRFGEAHATSRRKIARLNSDGTLDTTFLNGLIGANNDIGSVRLQSDGKILIAGEFTSFNGVTRNRIARLNTDGNLDQTFQTNLSGTGNFVSTAIEQPDGKILIGGFFSTVNGVSRNKLARLNSDGSLDSTFASGFTSQFDYINSIFIQSDGRILAGGFFFSVSQNQRQHITRLNNDGTLDPTLDFILLDAISTVKEIARQSDGKILFAGQFRYINGIDNSFIGRVNADGSRDLTFNIEPPLSTYRDSVTAIVPLPDGKILVGGNFTVISTRTYEDLVRLNNDGSVDNTFESAGFFCCIVNTVATQPDGKILVGGSFGSVSGVTRGNLARLNSDGSLDTSFFNNLQGTDNYVSALAVQPDGKIMIGGPFRKINGVSQSYIARLNSDGSLDTSFVSNINGIVNTIKQQPDGKYVIGGSFRFINNTSRNRIARLNHDGTLDTTFLNGLSGTDEEVYKIGIQSNGQIVITGFFNTVNGVSRKGIARLNSDGTLDTSFNYTFSPAGTGYAHGLLIEPNGNLLIGGYFKKVNSVTRASLFRIIQSNTQIFDFDGDGRSDVSVFRPESGVWHLQQSQSGYAAVGFGLLSDKLVPADYDGDGKTDVAVFRENPSDPGKAKFFILQSSNNQLREEQLGSTGDIPVSEDWDGDGRADVGVYRAGTVANQQGYFYYRPSSQPTVNFIPFPWGIAGDKPVVADYDGDGKADPAVFRPSNGAWYIQRSRDGFYAIQFGAEEDKPVVGDYDGDGKADQAVFRPSNGVWYLWNSSTGFSAAQFGISTDKPAPADYDGDGKTDMAVYRDGNWFILNSTAGFTSLGFGNAADRPVPNSFVP